MELVKINRLRGKTADFVESENGITTRFANMETETEHDFTASMEMTIENWRLFAQELTEALDVFESQSTGEDVVPDDGSGNEPAEDPDDTDEEP